MECSLISCEPIGGVGEGEHAFGVAQAVNKTSSRTALLSKN